MVLPVNTIAVVTSIGYTFWVEGVSSCAKAKAGKTLFKTTHSKRNVWILLTLKLVKCWDKHMVHRIHPCIPPDGEPNCQICSKVFFRVPSFLERRQHHG
mmetsp:Transcript_5224/g.6830  ORF Transcript_5224/g.6830 Transcript_5224/m.6830 type:complete len:99 (-) Transcript_5224:49-345(-)